MKKINQQDINHMYQRVGELARQVDKLNECIDTLNKDIDALGEEEEKPTPPSPRWKPGDAYYVILSEGTVYRTIWTDTNADIGSYNLGDVFKTEAEAKFALERLKVLAEMREWAGKWNDSYSIYYNAANGIINAAGEGTKLLTRGEMRFATENDAKNCIKVVGEDRLKKYYFMVPDTEE